MRISDWSSDVCSSDLSAHAGIRARRRSVQSDRTHRPSRSSAACRVTPVMNGEYRRRIARQPSGGAALAWPLALGEHRAQRCQCHPWQAIELAFEYARRSEEHTSELQSLMRNSYAVFCLKKKNKITNPTTK